MSAEVNPTIVNKIFDGVSTAAQAGKIAANSTINAFNGINQLIGNESDLFSRRDMGMQPQQQQLTYQFQPATYPWGNNTVLAGYGYDQGYATYAGIANPNYGMPGMYTGNNLFSGTIFGQPQQQQQGFNTTWCNNVWG